MKPISFPKQNVVYAKNQSEYLPLPAHKNPEGEVTSCWSLSWRERIRLVFTGRIWIHIRTFNQPLQPLLPVVEDPFRRMNLEIQSGLQRAWDHARRMEYLQNRFYLRGTSRLGLLNTVMATVCNRVLVVKRIGWEGEVVGWMIRKGTDFPRKKECFDERD